MSATAFKSPHAAAPAVRWLLLAWLGCLALAARADVITNVTVVNVTPSGFGVVWRATNSTPSIAVYADAAGLTNLAGQVGTEAFPLHTGNPDLAAGYARRLDAAALRQKTQALGLMMVRVSDCRPNTTYYFRLTSTPSSGAPEVYPASGPLPAVTTAQQNTFVADDQVVILDMPDPDSAGRIVLLSDTNAAYPLAAVVGDGVETNQVFFNMADLVAPGRTGNFTPTGDQSFAMDVLGANRTDQSQSYTLSFSANFATALTTMESLNSEFFALNVGSSVLRAGQSDALPISSDDNTNVTAIDLTLQIPSGHLSNLALQSLAPQLDPAASTLSAQNSSTWLLHFAALSGQIIAGSNVLARLAFTAVSNQTSAFVPVQIAALSATKADATSVGSTLARSGRVVVIQNQPLLEADFATDGSRQLTLFGKAWMSYAIECTTNLFNPSQWRQVRYFAQTNMVTGLAGLGAPGSNIFYRAVEFTPDPPVLDAVSAANGSAALLGYGRPGSHYTLLVKTNLSNVVPWSPLQTYTLTNSFQYLYPPAGGGMIFYRLQRN